MLAITKKLEKQYKLLTGNISDTSSSVLQALVREIIMKASKVQEES